MLRKFKALPRVLVELIISYAVLTPVEQLTLCMRRGAVLFMQLNLVDGTPVEISFSMKKNSKFVVRCKKVLLHRQSQIFRATKNIIDVAELMLVPETSCFFGLDFDSRRQVATQLSSCVSRRCSHLLVSR